MNERGFFLLETLFLGLILLAASAFLGVCHMGSQLQESSTMRLTAIFLAQKQLACVQGDKVIMGKTGKISWLDSGDESKLNKNGTLFLVTAQLSDVAAEPLLKQIEVTVQWQERKKECEVKLTRVVRCDDY